MRDITVELLEIEQKIAKLDAKLFSRISDYEEYSGVYESPEYKEYCVLTILHKELMQKEPK